MLNDISDYILSSSAWKQLSQSIEDCTCAQSISVVLPPELQEKFIIMFSEKLLAIDDVLNCPDFIQIGNYLVAPSIEETRHLRSELPLAPSIATKRLAIVWEANNLSIEAMNSLLKITEEPPQDSYILFVSSEDKLLSTIKSRVWNLYIDLFDKISTGENYPQNDLQWSSWFESNKKKTIEQTYIEVNSWISMLIKQKKYLIALELENSLKLIQQKKLPISMTQDIIYCLLKEDISSEQIFGNIW